MPELPPDLEFYDYDTRVAAYAVIVEGDRILLSWWNGEGRGGQAWSLPGGGVDLPESPERARSVKCVKRLASTPS